MRINFPQVDIPAEFISWTEVNEDILNVYQQSCRLKAIVFVLCTEGKVTASINLQKYVVVRGDLVVLLPGMIIQINEQHEKLRLSFAAFSSDCVNGINIFNSAKESFTYMLDEPILHLDDLTASYFKDYFSLMTRMLLHPEYAPQTEVNKNNLTFLLSWINSLYQMKPHPEKEMSRGEEICRQLVKEVMDHYQTERHVQFYADRLGISLQHLSTTVKQVTGRNVLDIIAHMVIMDAKAKLQSTRMTIQEVAYSLNFPSASFFGKYFKRYVGTSPQEFRKSGC